MEFFESELGIGNRLQLTRFWKTCRTYNLKNGLHPSESLYSGDYTVAMETGTGKTYVYLRTIFELYQRYGFATFIIVVPSVAIKHQTDTNKQADDNRCGFWPSE